MKHKKLTALILCFTMLFSITSGIFSAALAADSLEPPGKSRYLLGEDPRSRHRKRFHRPFLRTLAEIGAVSCERSEFLRFSHVHLLAMPSLGSASGGIFSGSSSKSGASSERHAAL